MSKYIYKGKEVDEGGYVYAEPGMYKDLTLLNIASMYKIVLLLNFYLVLILQNILGKLYKVFLALNMKHEMT